MKKYFSLKKRILKIHFRFKNDLKNFSVRYQRFLWLLEMFSRVRRITGLSRKYFWRSRKFFIFQNVSCVHFYKMKLGEVIFKAFVKPWKRPKWCFSSKKWIFQKKVLVVSKIQDQNRSLNWGQRTRFHCCFEL